MRLHAGPLAALAPLAVHPDPWVSAACLPQQPRSLVWCLQRVMRPPRAEFFFPWRRSQMKMNYVSARTKHFNRWLYYIREMRVDGLIRIGLITTQMQIADCLTKCLPKTAFLNMRQRLLS